MPQRPRRVARLSQFATAKIERASRLIRRDKERPSALGVWRQTSAFSVVSDDWWSVDRVGEAMTSTQGVERYWSRNAWCHSLVFLVASPRSGLLRAGQARRFAACNAIASNGCRAAFLFEEPTALTPRFCVKDRRGPMSALVRSDGAGFVAGSLMAFVAFAIICLITISL